MAAIVQSAVVLLALCWACEPWLVNPEADKLHPAVFRTAWVAVALGFVAMVRRFRGGGKWVWAAGCGVFVVHLICAFDVVHRWSHANAFRHVEEASGFGPGIFVSYLFTLVWLADATWWASASKSYLARSRWVNVGVYGFLGFITFNGTVVYGVDFGRWLGVVGFAAIVVAAVRR